MSPTYSTLTIFIYGSLLFHFNDFAVVGSYTRFPFFSVARLSDLVRNAVCVLVCHEAAVLVLGLHITIDVFHKEELLKSHPLVEDLLCIVNRELGKVFAYWCELVHHFAAFVVAGFNWRYAWLVLPDWIVWSAAVVFILCYLLYAEVMRENAYLSRTIEVQEGQRVVDTGLYGVVRHPMYTATTLLFLAMPLVLASPISSLIMLLYIPLIVVRIIHEERYLKVNLEGYTEYTKRIRYRLIPYIW